MLGRAVSSEVERFVDTEEVSGSIPLSPTILVYGGVYAYRN